MATGSEISLSILFERRPDGRFRVSSSDIPDFHLAGADWEALRADLEPLIKGLLWQNSKFAAYRLEWVPSLSTIAIRVANEGSAVARITVKGSSSVSRLRLEIAARRAYHWVLLFAMSLLRSRRKRR